MNPRPSLLFACFDRRLRETTARQLQRRCQVDAAVCAEEGFSLVLGRRYDVVVAALDPSLRGGEWLLYQAACEQPWATRVLVSLRPPASDAVWFPPPLSGAGLLDLLFGNAA